MSFDPGRMRERITIRRATEVDNGKGGYTTSWADIATISAEVVGLDGRESVMEQVLQGVSVFRLRIRWRQDLRASDQLRSAKGAFGQAADGSQRDANIRSIVDPDGARQWLVIVAETASTR